MRPNPTLRHLYRKITEPTDLYDQMYAFLGDCYLVFKLKKPQDDEGGSFKELHVDVMCPKSPPMLYRFKHENVADKTILCGRGPHCHV